MQADAQQTNPTASEALLVKGRRLLELVFEPEARPRLRWLQTQVAKRALPFVKIGSKVFFDPDKVRQAIAERFAVVAK